MLRRYRLAAFSWGLAILVAGCAVSPVREAQWPVRAPARAYFEQVYDKDPENQLMQTQEEYLQWIREFYLGSDVCPFGWLELERSLLAQTAASLRSDTAEKLRRLGQRISANWAKDNRLRRVTKTMLLIWSQVIQEAAETGEHLAAIDMIEADVAALLDGRLPARAISSERYARWISEVPEIL